MCRDVQSEVRVSHANCKPSGGWGRENKRMFCVTAQRSTLCTVAWRRPGVELSMELSCRLELSCVTVVTRRVSFRVARCCVPFGLLRCAAPAGRHTRIVISLSLCGIRHEKRNFIHMTVYFRFPHLLHTPHIHSTHRPRMAPVTPIKPQHMPMARRKCRRRA